MLSVAVLPKRLDAVGPFLMCKEIRPGRTCEGARLNGFAFVRTLLSRIVQAGGDAVHGGTDSVGEGWVGACGTLAAEEIDLNQA